MSVCGLVLLVCSVPGCDSPFEVMRPTAEDLHEPLCPQHKKGRLVQTETPGCADPDVWNCPRPGAD